MISRKALRWELSDEPRNDPTLKEMFKNCTQLREWKFFTHSACKFSLKPPKSRRDRGRRQSVDYAFPGTIGARFFISKFLTRRH